MIYLITGQPGNGKTLMAMELMRQEYERNQEAVKEGKEEPRRFFSNVAGATTEENPDAFPWVEKLPDHNDWTQLPDGSYVQYDEAHSDGNTPGLERYGKLFPSTGKPGESSDLRIRAMSTHRHRGFDLVLITQWPNKVHHQVRTLVGKHVHMNRAMGLQRAGVLSWTRTQVDPYNEREREKAEEEIWSYPKDLYGKYKSSTLHTASYKFKIPRKVWGGLSMLLMTGIVGWCLWLFVFKPDSNPTDTQVDRAPAAQAEGLWPGAPPPSRDEPIKWETPAEYAEEHLPRFPTMPWTAKVFDDRAAISDPQLYCMASGPGRNGSGEVTQGGCHCVTEQGTRYELGEGECRRVARYGTPYNPYRERRDGRGEQPAPEPMPADRGRLLPLPFDIAGEVGTAPRPTVAPEYGQLTRPAP